MRSNVDDIDETSESSSNSDNDDSSSYDQTMNSSKTLKKTLDQISEEDENGFDQRFNLSLKESRDAASTMP